MGAIELFVHDVLDLGPEKLGDLYGRIVSGSSIHLDVLLASPAMTSNLAFHEAWKAATMGSHPSRLDYETFVQNLPAANPGSGAAWCEPTHNALMASLSVGTHIGIHPQHSKLAQSAGEAYQRVLASLGEHSSRPAAAKRLLLAKLSDRFGGIADESTSIIAAYASLVLSDPHLNHLEQWAFPDAIDGGRAPKSVVEYYERVDASGKLVNLPFRSPLTGLHLDLGGGATTMLRPLSCLELLRIPLSRDGHLWRRDSGGSILIMGRCSSKLHASFKIRESRGIPSSFIYNALPLPLYSRIVVFDDLAECTKPRGGPGELVRITTVEGDGGTSAGGPRTILFADDPPRDSHTYWIPKCFAPPQDDALLKKDGPDGPQYLTDLTTTSMLTAQLQKPCPLRAASAPGANVLHAGAVGGDLLYHKFVARYAKERGLDRRVFETSSDGKGKTGEVVLVDNRINVWSVWSILITLDNLRTADWAVTVFCSDANVSFMRSCIIPHVPNARIEVLEELNKQSPFDIETYNGILKDPAFWDKIESPRALIVQDDGLLVLPGLDDDSEILAQDFVGAPWMDAPGNRKVLEGAGVGSGLVGNGGFSLRNVKAMREIARTDGDTGHGHATFNGNTQPVPEDVFFAAAVERRGRSCPRAVAERFAFEQNLPTQRGPAASKPLGFHKPWPYNHPSELNNNLFAATPQKINQNI